MTYISNWIEIKTGGPGDGTADATCLLDAFPPPNHGYGPNYLQAWARSQNLPIEYIDNCWLRVEVTADQLRTFLNELYAKHPACIAEALSKINISERYVIVAEEF
jgi:hypothetical protein